MFLKGLLKKVQFEISDPSWNNLWTDQSKGMANSWGERHIRNHYTPLTPEEY